MNQHDNTAPLLADADDGIAAKGLPWLLVVAGALVYANSLANPFVFDDHGAIVVHARKLGVWPPRELLAAPPDSSFAGRPVVAFTIAVEGGFALDVVEHVVDAANGHGTRDRTTSRPMPDKTGYFIALRSTTAWSRMVSGKVDRRRLHCSCPQRVRFVRIPYSRRRSRRAQTGAIRAVLV